MGLGAVISSTADHSRSAAAIDSQTIKPETIAEMACRKAVLSSLKSPDSVEWQRQSADYIQQVKPGQFHIQTKAYALNSFGARMLDTFDCRVSCSKAGCVTTRLTDMGQRGR